MNPNEPRPFVGTPAPMTFVAKEMFTLEFDPKLAPEIVTEPPTTALEGFSVIEPDGIVKVADPMLPERPYARIV